MAKHGSTEIIQGDPIEHPAVQAWCELQSTRAVPEHIAILKRRKDSSVYRLVRVGPGGSNVIAKRCLKASALVERTIYEEVLSHLPLTVLQYYGLLEDDIEFCWVFLEDAEGVPYTPDVEEHRVIAAEWLGIMHTCALGPAAGLNLPDRGPSYHLGCLRSARERIRENLTNAALSEGDRTILGSILTQCNLVEQQWRHVEESCAGIPWTFLHADLQESNLHVRSGPNGTDLLPFDWESAGWGVPAIDLGLTGLDLPTYWSVVQRSWSGLKVDDVERLAAVGRLFQLLALIDWEGKSLSSEWLHRPMKHMRGYEAGMSEIIQAVKADW